MRAILWFFCIERCINEISHFFLLSLRKMKWKKLRMKKLSVHKIQHVPKCLSCRKAILVMTGDDCWCFHDLMITYVLFPSCFCKFYIYIYIYIWYMICVIFVISKRRSSLGQTIVKIIHKMKRMVKFVKKWILTPSSYAHSFLSTTKHLGKIRLHIGFTPFANYSVNVFWTNQNLIVLQKCPIFFLFTASKNIKNHKEKFEVGCSYKDCNQFLLPKNYRLWN